MSLVPSARGFSRIARRELRTALAGVEGEVPITPDVDTAAAAAAGQRVSAVAQAAADPVEVPVDVDRRRVARAFRRAFAGNPQLLQALRTGVPSVLASPVGAAAGTLGAVFAASFGSAVIANLALGGLGAGILGLGVFGVREHPKVVAGFESLVSQLNETLAEIAAPVVPHLLGFFDTIARGFDERIAPLLAELIEFMSPALGQVAVSLLQGLEGFLEPLTRPDVMQGIRTFFLEALPQLARLGPAVAEFFVQMARHAPALADALAIVVGILINLIGVFTFIIKAGTGFLLFWDRLWDLVGSAISTAGEFIRFWFGRIDNIVRSVGQRIGERVRGIIDAFRSLRDRIARIPRSIAAALSSLPATFGRIFGRARSVVADRIRGVVRLANNLPGRIRRAVGDLSNLLWRAGRNLIAGLIRGITSQFRWLQDTLRWVTNRIPDWKGPLDDDRRLLRPAGQAVLEGFRRGILDEVPAVERTLRGVTGDIAGHMPAGSAGAAGATVTIDATGLPRALATWLRGAVRTQGGGSVQRFAGQAA